MHPIPLPNIRQLSLIAGGSFLLMALVAGFSYGYVLQPLSLHKDVAATTLAIQNAMPLFRWAIAGFIFILILDVVIAWSLYYILETNGKVLVLLASWLRLVYAALLGIAITHLFAAQWVSGHRDARMGLSEDSGAVYYLELFDKTWSMALILAGFHLFVLGLVLLRVTRMPRIIGWLALLAAVCYIGTCYCNLLWPGYSKYRLLADQLLCIPMAAGEIPLAFWLLFRGGKPGTTSAALSVS